MNHDMNFSLALALALYDPSCSRSPTLSHALALSRARSLALYDLFTMARAPGEGRSILTIVGFF